MRVVFMGTPDFAVPCLEALIKNGHNVSLCVTKPDMPVGRKQILTAPPVKNLALANNIKVYQPNSLRTDEAFQIIDNEQPDVIVVVAYGKILPKNILDISKYGCVNVHASLLPKLRGASPIQSEILNGDEETGISIIEMLKEMDAGDILYKKKIQIKKYETAEELFDRMSWLGQEALKVVLDKIVQNEEIVKEKQDEGQVTFTTKIAKEQGLLDFETMDAQTVKNLVYGLNSWPSAYMVSNNLMYKIHKVLLTDNISNKQPATICNVYKDGIEVVCADKKTVIITEIQKQGKKKMNVESYLLGNPIHVGTKITEI